MPKPSQALPSCNQRDGGNRWFPPSPGLLLGDQRFDLEDLPLQGRAVLAAQVGVADLTPGLEGLAVVMQVAVVDGDNFFHWRYNTNEVEHGALTDLGRGAQRQARHRPQVV